MPSSVGRIVAVCTSSGGIPKQSVRSSLITTAGLAGDGHAHDKHNRADRAVSLFDWEILTQLQAAGFPLYPGAIGENLTVAGLHVQQLPVGTLLAIGDVLLRLEQPRKPCYVLDAIDPALKDILVGRCGYMASVAREGIIDTSMQVSVLTKVTQSYPISPSTCRSFATPKDWSGNLRPDRLSHQSSRLEN